MTIRTLCACLALLLGTACTAPRPHPSAIDSCRSYLAAVDSAVAANGCGNAAYVSVAGVPALRTSRFWSSFGDRNLGDAAFEFWVDELRRLDHEAREGELACLPQPSVTGLLAVAPEPSKGGLAATVEVCSEAVKKDLLTDRTDLRQRLAGQIVPDDYRFWRRAVGLYPLFYGPVALGVANAYGERADWYRRDLSEWLADGSWQTLGPPTATGLRAGEIAGLLRAAAANPLGVALPEPPVARRLAEALAPVLVQQTAGPADHWGEMVRSEEGTVGVGEAPVVYYYLDQMTVAGVPRLRINYVTWYPERSGEVTPWIERGPFDGLTIGVILDSDGRPLLVQTMNNCGCYLQFFPAPQWQPVPVPWYVPAPLSLQTLPATVGGERLSVYVNSGWHQVLRLAALVPEPGAATYRLVPYSDLERLAGADGRSRSIFTPEGLLPGSERIERFLFFSLGIPSVGSMRQRGHQPVTLLGREHYDDPRLIDRTLRPRP